MRRPGTGLLVGLICFGLLATGVAAPAFADSAGSQAQLAKKCKKGKKKKKCKKKKPSAPALPNPGPTNPLPPLDTDADGVPDSLDNCDTAANPGQADADMDTTGDACDVCPNDAYTTTCSPVDPNDSDSDGVPNAEDNCPSLANPTQEDADMDGKGNVCDTCPNEANPGAQACPLHLIAVEGGMPCVNQATIGSVTLNNPAPADTEVMLQSSDPDLGLPASVTVTTGNTIGNFSFTPTVEDNYTITATLNADVVQDTVTVLGASAPACA